MEDLHAVGFHIRRDEPVAIGSVVLVPQRYARDSAFDSPSVHAMSPDGTQIRWVIEPSP